MAAPPPYDFEKSKDYGQGYVNQGKIFFCKLAFYKCLKVLIFMQKLIITQRRLCNCRIQKFWRIYLSALIEEKFFIKK